ncbi:hypothetical protein ACJX0J_032321, partial [Zea mays]
CKKTVALKRIAAKWNIFAQNTRITFPLSCRGSQKIYNLKIFKLNNAFISLSFQYLVGDKHPMLKMICYIYPNAIYYIPVTSLGNM